MSASPATTGPLGLRTKPTGKRRSTNAPSPDLSHNIILYVEGVTKSFDGFKALNDLSIYIETGELRCIIGPNGAGKSTLLKLIAGEIAPDDGRIARNEGLRIARMPQEVPRDLVGTVFDVIALGGGDTGLHANAAPSLREPCQASPLLERELLELHPPGLDF